MTRSVLIIGGGAIGLATAWELSRRGCRVTLLERDRIGAATSWAATGILPPANLDLATDPIDQLRGLSHRLFPEWADRLRSATGIDIGFRRCGGWYLADSPGERAAMLGMADYWSQLGIECQSVHSDQLARREPALATWCRGREGDAAWWTPGECQVRPPKYLRALAQACRDGGVELVEHAAVDDIRDSAAARVGTRWYSADSLVVCGGPWTGHVGAALRLERAIVPVRGQIVLLKTDEALLKSVVNVGHRYVVCRDDGHTLIGSCEEEVGFRLGTDAATVDSLLEFASGLLPSLRTARRLREWSALRPMTFDGFPILGRVPDLANVYVAAGHYRSGVHMSPGTAVVMADVLVGRPPGVPTPGIPMDAFPMDAFRVGKQQSSSSTTPRS